MQPKGIAIFEGDRGMSSTVAEYLRRIKLCEKVFTAAEWEEAHQVVAGAKREGIDAFVINRNLLPHRNPINREKGLVRAIRELKLVPPPLIIDISEHAPERHGERIEGLMLAPRSPAGIAITIIQAK